MNVDVKFLWSKKDERCFAFSAVLCRGWHDVFLFFYFFDVEISVCAKDWMLPGADHVLDDGRVFKTFSKNPKYINQKIYTFIFP